MKLADFSTLTFDCYGTLIDWESGILRSLEPLTSRLEKPLSPDAILEAHGRHESAQQAATPSMLYRDLLAVVYRLLAGEWGVDVEPEESEAYGLSVGNWPAFDDSAEALAYLQDHYRLVILSNVDDASFRASNERLGVEFDAVYTAEAIGSYKPSDGNFDHMLRHLAAAGVHRSEILHTAESLFHDHVPARRHELATCWIHRRHGRQGFGATRRPDEIPAVDFRFTSLAELVDAHRSAR